MSTAARQSKAPAAPETSRETPWKKVALELLPLIVVLMVALHSLCVFTLVEGSAPSDAEWTTAADLLREHHQAGELIVFAPQWIDPLGRKAVGDLMSIEMAARMDAARYSTIWELSRDGARAPETRGLASDLDEQIGPLRVRRYRQEPAVLVTDFGAQLVRAKVSGAGRAKLSLEEVGFEPHRCVKVVPQPDKTVSVLYEAVPLGSHIQGYVGLADVFTRRDVRDPGRLELFVNDALVAETLVGVDDGWVAFRADTAAASSAKVEFKLTAVGPKAKDRRICFSAEARK